LEAARHQVVEGRALRGRDPERAHVRDHPPNRILRYRTLRISDNIDQVRFGFRDLFSQAFQVRFDQETIALELRFERRKVGFDSRTLLSRIPACVDRESRENAKQHGEPLEEGGTPSDPLLVCHEAPSPGGAPLPCDRITG
jgi:hypothetical protein